MSVPVISVSPSSVRQGETINVYFGGFLDPVTIAVAGGGSSLYTGATDGGIGLVITDAPGVHTMVATDDLGGYASVVFTVTAPSSSTVVVQPSSINSGDSITVTWSSFQVDSVVFLSVNDQDGLPVFEHSYQSDLGTGSGGRTIPIAGNSGIYIVTVADDFGNVARTDFTVTAVPPSVDWAQLYKWPSSLLIPLGEPIPEGWVQLYKWSTSLIIPLGEPIPEGWVQLYKWPSSLRIILGEPIPQGWVMLYKWPNAVTIKKPGAPSGGSSKTALILGGAALAGIALASMQNKTPTTRKK